MQEIIYQSNTAHRASIISHGWRGPETSLPVVAYQNTSTKIVAVLQKVMYPHGIANNQLVPQVELATLMSILYSEIFIFWRILFSPQNVGLACHF